MGTHELFTNRNGTVSLRELHSGEVMHSNVGPRDEATLLYINQSRLAERLQSGSGELILWDGGLGAATNALAALQCRRTLPSGGRPLRIISFENDVSGLKLAFENRARFPFFDGLEPAVTALLTQRRWRSDDGLSTWDLVEGDFLDLAPLAPSPELIFFDFYSPKTASQFWTVATFDLIRAAADTRFKRGLATTLFTYSASTKVRSALLMAGFHVGYGHGTGAKVETTVASTDPAELERPLDARWLLRVKRSEDRLPYGWERMRENELLATIYSHPQFNKPEIGPATDTACR